MKSLLYLTALLCTIQSIHTQQIILPIQRTQKQTTLPHHKHSLQYQHITELRRKHNNAHQYSNIELNTLHYNTQQRQLLQTDTQADSAVFVPSFSTDLQNNQNILLLNTYYSTAYTYTISVGTPAQNFTVLFDTGSSDAWVQGIQVDNATQYTDQQYYNSTQSTTAKSIGMPEWYVSYADGIVSGFYINDTVTLGNFTIPSTTIAIANNTVDGGSFPSDPLEGVFGLAYDALTYGGTLNKTNYGTILDTLYTNGLIKEKVFSVILEKTSETEIVDASSYLIFGEPLTDLAPNGFTHAAILQSATSYVNTSTLPHSNTVADNKTSYGYYLIGLTDVQLDGQSSGLCNTTTTNPCQAIIDTGTSLLTCPTTVYQQFTQGILQTRPDCNVNQQTGVIDCDITLLGYTGLPNITFVINGTDFMVTPQQYFQQNILGIQALDVGLSTTNNGFILGDVFLQQYYTVFNQQNNTMSFATPNTVNIKYGIIDVFTAFFTNVSSYIVNPTIFYNPLDVSTYFAEIAPAEAIQADLSRQSATTGLYSTTSVKAKRSLTEKLVHHTKNALFDGIHTLKTVRYPAYSKLQ